MEVVASCQDADEAAARLGRLLDLTDEASAQAVLDMQVRRWTRAERDRMEQWRDQLRTELDGP